jgi:extradiol dioxygenase family protein
MLDHLAIQCEDVDASAAFYDAVLAYWEGSGSSSGPSTRAQ